MWGVIITRTLNSHSATSELWQKRTFSPPFWKDTEENGAGSCQGSRAPSLVFSQLAPRSCLQAALWFWERLCWQGALFLQSSLLMFLETVLYPGDSFRLARLESRSGELGRGSAFLSFVHKGWECGVVDGVQVDEELITKSVFSLFSVTGI